MTPICKDIFKAIHEGKWLKIEYRNQAGNLTNYWIGIREVDPLRRMLTVDGLHIRSHAIDELHIFIDSIQTSVVLEGTYFETNPELIRDIEEKPEKYRGLFDNVANLKILTYLEVCNRYDSTPYQQDFDLIKCMDRDSFTDGVYTLSDEQYSQIIKDFSIRANRIQDNAQSNIKVKQLVMNVLSVKTPKGLYVLAYRKLNLDVKKRLMRPEKDITICAEFQLDGNWRETARKYLDADDYSLLDDFDANQEKIKDAITRSSSGKAIVDDLPYVIGIGMDIIVDLHSEYQAIIKMMEEGTAPIPLKAFFGDLLDKPRRTKSYPMALLNQKVNLDQLLAINKAMQYPIAYIQGPPGTGKTNTIINTIITAFFNERTVLFASNNNHPIDGVFEKLTGLQYEGKRILFPILRLGNVEKLGEAIDYIKSLLETAKGIIVFDKTLDKRKDDRSERAKKLTEHLRKYEEYLDLKERKETLKDLISAQEKTSISPALFPFNIDLKTRQLREVEEKIAAMPTFTEREALDLIDQNEDEFAQYLYYLSAKYIKRLEGDRFADLREIIDIPEKSDAVSALSKFLSDSDNVKRLQRVFPIIVTTCMSAHRLGKPEPLFDMTIIDEASQCNTAMSLVPILRGENLMLVGDPQQLNPVILLDAQTNEKLKKEYQVPDEYDYRTNSIYKTFLASDSVSDEILLHNHYRCHPKIINFNNKKYYNSQLNVCTEEKNEAPLIFVDVENPKSAIKNTSLEEARQIVEYVRANQDKNIGIVTPFVNQKNLITSSLEQEGLTNASCGTVHSFQGDEKEEILFSLAIGAGTGAGTYEWLRTNREIINVATSRAQKRLIILGDSANVNRLQQDVRANTDPSGVQNHELQSDDLYELINYVRSEGKTVVTPKETNSRALGVKPFSTETEAAFMQSLSHALDNIFLTQARFVVHKEVAISQVFEDNLTGKDLFYTGRFDFVVYEKTKEREIPVLAIELDGKEHMDDAIVRRRDEQKNQICKAHHLQLIRVENAYARRYNFIKTILMDYFKVRH